MRKRRSVLFLAFACVLLPVTSGSALATAPNNDSATYEWHLEVPNVAMAPNGDTIAVTGQGRSASIPSPPPAAGASRMPLLAEAR